MKIPDCVDGRKYHGWRKGVKKFGESGICLYCGWDKFENQYRVL